MNEWMNEWMDGWMDGWRRPNHMRSHLDAIQTMSSVNLRRLPRRFHSIAKQASLSVAFRSDFEGFGNDFGTLWEAKMDANIDFWEVILQCLFRMRFFIDLGSFLGPRKSEKSWKTIGFSMVFANFQKINVFETNAKKPRFWRRLRRPKPWEIEKKWCWKPCVFLTSIFHRFFSFFHDFGSILGGPGGSKNQ